LVKDEKHFDKFDRAFKHFFDGVESTATNPLDSANIPDDWLRKEIEKTLTPEEFELKSKKWVRWKSSWKSLKNVCKSSISAIKVAIKWLVQAVRRPLVLMVLILKAFV
jgi:uncharacterized protein with von Willebrand factor type A (vWA) domain